MALRVRPEGVFGMAQRRATRLGKASGARRPPTGSRCRSAGTRRSKGTPRQASRNARRRGRGAVGVWDMTAAPKLTLVPSTEHRVPPHDLAAEAAVLSASISGEQIVRMATIVQPEDFYSEAYRRIFEACVRLHESGARLD